VKRNVLLVSVDSLRYDTFYDEFYNQNGVIRELLEDGLIFDHAVAPGPYTEVSIPSTLVGEFIFHDEENSNEYVRTQIQCHETLADCLSHTGYSTAGFSPNPHASRYYGLDSGFDVFEDFLESDDKSEVIGRLADRFSSGDLVEGIRLAANALGLSIPGFGNQSIPLRAYEPDLIRWVENTEQPWFLWTFMLEPHSPFRPTKKYRQTSLLRMLRLNLIWSNLYERNPTAAELAELRGLYNSAVRMTADSVGRLYSKLESYNPVVIIHSDHGEAFGEHGDFGHTNQLYEENVHVPLAVLNSPNSGRVQEPISLTKIPEMIAEIGTTGAISPETYTRDTVFSRIPGHSVSARRLSEKIIADGKLSNYNLLNDPKEQNPKTTNNTRPLREFISHQTELMEIKNAASDDINSNSSVY
jgi:arylsulfatase A-like enzyme